MIDVHVVASVNRHLYDPLMADYHRRRHDVFIKERRWTHLTDLGDMEFDEYDDDHAIYLVMVDGERVVGGQRLYSTSRPHMLSEVFAYLVQWPLPRSADTWECTRYFIAPERRGGPADARLLIAMQQFCLEEGISSVTGVSEIAALSRRLQAGIMFRPLGLPQDVDGEPTIAVIADITPESFRASQRMLGTRRFSLVRRGIEIGWVARREYDVALSA